MVFKRLFKDKPTESEVVTREAAEPFVRQLALRTRGAFDLDEILQLVAQTIGEQLHVDHCMVYLCDPSSDTLRWRAGYQEPELTPLRWPLRESDFPQMFQLLRNGSIVRIEDPLNDPLVSAERSRFESAGVQTLVFVPAWGEQLEAVVILGQVSSMRRWSDLETEFVETVAAQVAMAVRHVRLASELRRAGNQVYSATVELQSENQHLLDLNNLLLLPPADLTHVLNHITESLVNLYKAKACSIEELQDETVTVRSMRMPEYTTELGVFVIEGTPRQTVLNSAQPRTVLNAVASYPEDRFLRENNLDFYAGIPITSRGGDIIGLLNLYHTENLNLQKRDLKTLGAIARRIGAEMENESSARRREESEREIQWRLEAATQWEEQMKFLQEARELLRQSESLEQGLEEMVTLANRHMGSEFAALALHDEQGQTAQLTTAGIDLSVREAIGDLPTNDGLLGLLSGWAGPLRIDNITAHPRFTGFPPNHPVMHHFLGVPLRARGMTVGALYFADKHNGEPFSNDDELFASELASQVALAVAAPVVTVSAEAGRPEGRVTIPAEASTIPSSGPPVSRDWSLFTDLLTLIERGSPADEVCTSVVGKLIQFFPGTVAGVWLIEPSTQSLIHTVGEGGPIDRVVRKGAIPLGEGVIGRASISGVPLAMKDLNEDQAAPDEIKSLLSPDEPYDSVVIQPLKTADSTSGILLIFGSGPVWAEAESHSLLHLVAYCLGSAIGQRRMGETIAQHSMEMGKIQTVIESIGEPGTLGKICDEILTQLGRSLDASSSAVFLHQGGDRELLLFRHQGLDDSLAGLGRRISVDQAEASISTLSSGDILVVSELEKDPHIVNQELVNLLRAEGLRSGVVLPLRSKNELIGLVALASQSVYHFSHFSREFFSILTSRIAGMLEQHLRRESGAAPLPTTLATPAVQFSEALLANLDSGVVAIDREGHIITFNPAMERLTGYRHDDAHGKLIGTEGLSLFAQGQPFTDALIQGRVISWDDLLIVTKGGSKKHVSVIVTPLADERGALAGALGIFTDITEIRALEHERYRLTPLALIGEMSARLAHEIKNPLASMMSGLELLKRRLEYGEREGRYFDRLIAELQRLDTTVREMLAYSRTTPPSVARVDPAEPLERALDTLTPQLDAGHIHVHRNYQLAADAFVMDANQMEQVFLNLILNAIHAMPEGGTLEASLRSTSSSDEGEAESGLVAIEYVIKDTGIGIPPEIVDKIFDPFFSTKTHGTGLGLASVQKIIEAHQGQISVDTKVGQGTAFTIRLKPTLTTEDGSAPET